jgi:hypothetical protein
MTRLVGVLAPYVPLRDGFFHTLCGFLEVVVGIVEVADDAYLLDDPVTHYVCDSEREQIHT